MNRRTVRLAVDGQQRTLKKQERSCKGGFTTLVSGLSNSSRGCQARQVQGNCND